MAPSLTFVVSLFKLQQSYRQVATKTAGITCIALRRYAKYSVWSGTHFSPHVLQTWHLSSSPVEKEKVRYPQHPTTTIMTTNSVHFCGKMTFKTAWVVRKNCEGKHPMIFVWHVSLNHALQKQAWRSVNGIILSKLSYYGSKPRNSWTQLNPVAESRF